MVQWSQIRDSQVGRLALQQLNGRRRWAWPARYQRLLELVFVL